MTLNTTSWQLCVCTNINSTQWRLCALANVHYQWVYYCTSIVIMFVNTTSSYSTSVSLWFKTGMQLLIWYCYCGHCAHTGNIRMLMKLVNSPRSRRELKSWRSWRMTWPQALAYRCIVSTTCPTSQTSFKLTWTLSNTCSQDVWCYIKTSTWSSCKEVGGWGLEVSVPHDVNGTLQ